MGHAFWIVSAAFALLYGARYCWCGPSPAKALVKTVPLAALASGAALGGAPWLLVAALALSALGDLALAFEGERAFLAGLGSFAAAHLAYVALFAGYPGPPPLLPSLAFVALGLSTLRWLVPYAGDMAWPVRLYVAIICAMGILALAGPPAVVAGALMFAASDTILAVQLFRMDPASPLQRLVSTGLWTLYWGGQALIVAGVMAG